MTLYHLEKQQIIKINKEQYRRTLMEDTKQNNVKVRGFNMTKKHGIKLRHITKWEKSFTHQIKG